MKTEGSENRSAEENIIKRNNLRRRATCMMLSENEISIYSIDIDLTLYEIYSKELREKNYRGKLTSMCPY